MKALIYYFSTQGCSLVLSWSFGVEPFEGEAPLVAATAAARALLLKKSAITPVMRMYK